MLDGDVRMRRKLLALLGLCLITGLHAQGKPKDALAPLEKFEKTPVMQIRKIESKCSTAADAVKCQAYELLSVAQSRIVGVEAAVSRSEEHTSELQSLMRISYAVFCLKKKKNSMRSNADILIIVISKDYK